MPPLPEKPSDENLGAFLFFQYNGYSTNWNILRRY